MHALDEQWRTTDLPTTDAEIWRYSRIEELDLTRFEPRSHTPEVTGPPDCVRTGGDPVDLFPAQRPAVFAHLNATFPATKLRWVLDRAESADLASSDAASWPLHRRGRAGLLRQSGFAPRRSRRESGESISQAPRFRPTGLRSP